MNNRSNDRDKTGGAGPVAMAVAPRASDLGNGFIVQRALPSAKCRMVGPFVFFDQMGPALLKAGTGLDVRPHPHIGLATVTYLFEGEILHRDSLGTVQAIRPGAVNWMTAGSGIVHSERTPATQREHDKTLSGIQTWVALPARDEEMEPDFVHHDAGALPALDGEGKRVRVIVGELYGAHSPVSARSAMFYADAVLHAGAMLDIPARYEERAIYVVEGTVRIHGHDEAFGAGRLVVLGRVGVVVLQASTDARVMLLGGEPMDGPRFVAWNFVSSSRARIEQAKSDWREGRFARVPGETEFIPLPEENPPPVNYP